LALDGVYITAPVRCAPPANTPNIVERDTCKVFLERELTLLTEAKVILALGAYAWDAVLRTARSLGHPVPRPKPRHGHGAEAAIGPWTLLGSYHPSQQNTFTGRLTEAMLDDVMRRARELAGAPDLS
jgi:uracil-DNA glycosylase family 4